jgi:hypothetical protein
MTGRARWGQPQALSALAAFALALAGCHSPEERRAEPLSLTGPPHTLRVALDPQFGDATVDRALAATPLRADPATGALRPGLCRSWRAASGGRQWTLECRHAAEIARRLRARRGLFRSVRSVEVRGRRVVVRLGFDWRRFPYALTSPSAAPRGVPGPFRLVSRSPRRIVVRRSGLTVVFRRLEPYAALRAFRRGELDEAPVPQGEIRAVEADPTLGAALRARPLLGIDVVAFDPALVPRSVRRAYWLTVPRGEYQGLVSERVAPPAYGLLRGAEATSPADVRRARASIGDLPRISVRLAVPDRPELVDAAELAWAEWRQLRLPVRLASDTRQAEARFVRAIAAYPHPEGIYATLGLRADAPLAEIDERLRQDALLVPLGHVAEARLVSPRVHGWYMDALGVVDYSRVTLEAGP